VERLEKEEVQHEEERTQTWKSTIDHVIVKGGLEW
jgi:hypothetical protein